MWKWGNVILEESAVGPVDCVCRQRLCTLTKISGSALSLQIRPSTPQKIAFPPIIPQHILQIISQIRFVLSASILQIVCVFSAVTVGGSKDVIIKNTPSKKKTTMAAPCKGEGNSDSSWFRLKLYTFQSLAFFSNFANYGWICRTRCKPGNASVVSALLTRREGLRWRRVSLPFPGK